MASELANSPEDKAIKALMTEASADLANFYYKASKVFFAFLT